MLFNVLLNTYKLFWPWPSLFGASEWESKPRHATGVARGRQRGRVSDCRSEAWSHTRFSCLFLFTERECIQKETVVNWSWSPLCESWCFFYTRFFFFFWSEILRRDWEHLNPNYEYADVTCMWQICNVWRQTVFFTVVTLLELWRIGACFHGAKTLCLSCNFENQIVIIFYE